MATMTGEVLETDVRGIRGASQVVRGVKDGAADDLRVDAAAKPGHELFSDVGEVGARVRPLVGVIAGRVERDPF